MELKLKCETVLVFFKGQNSTKTVWDFKVKNETVLVQRITSLVLNLILSANSKKDKGIKIKNIQQDARLGSEESGFDSFSGHLVFSKTFSKKI